MKTVNSLSGGKTSSYLAMHYPADYDVFSVVCIDDAECAPNDPALIHYANAKLEQYGYVEQYGEFIATAEDDRTLRAMMDLEQAIGREIVWVRGKSFDDLIDQTDRTSKRTWLPSWARRYCTLEMKLEPIFYWWFHNLGEKVKMRIGFRHDEHDRMERFMNSNESGGGGVFSIPVSCSTRGQRRQTWETFDWRFVTFPLIRDSVNNQSVSDFWNRNWIGGQTIFDGPRRQIDFPEISNCVGCFHKKAETLAIMATTNPAKMRWFARQEDKGMGTWLDSKTRYDQIIAHAQATPYTIEMLRESGAACDSGGCTD